MITTPSLKVSKKNTVVVPQFYEVNFDGILKN